MPRFVDEEDVEKLKNLITLGEIEVVFLVVQKDKSPRPDGWPIEFYLTFFYHIELDLH